MKPVKIILAIVLLTVIGIVAMAWSFFSEHRTSTNFPPRGERIVVLGDSLSAGVGASSKETGYVALLEKRLGVSIINSSVSGNTTEDGLSRYDRDITPADPDILIILLGGNDYLRKVPPETTFTNLRTIIEKAQAQGAHVLLLGVQGGLLKDNFESRFAMLAEETGSTYVPNVLDDIIGNTALMSDQIHPNDNGYLKMADKIAPKLEGLIAAARAAQK